MFKYFSNIARWNGYGLGQLAGVVFLLLLWFYVTFSCCVVCVSLRGRLRRLPSWPPSPRIPSWHLSPPTLCPWFCWTHASAAMKHLKIVKVVMMMGWRIILPVCVRTVKNGRYFFRCNIDRSSSKQGLIIGLVGGVLVVLVSGGMAGVMGRAWWKTGFGWIGTIVRADW